MKISDWKLHEEEKEVKINDQNDSKKIDEANEIKMIEEMTDNFRNNKKYVLNNEGLKNERMNESEKINDNNKNKE